MFTVRAARRRLAGAVVSIAVPLLLAPAGYAVGAPAAKAVALRVLRVVAISGPVGLPAGCSPVRDENTAQLAVDPGDPRHLVAAYTVGVAVAEVVAVSTDGGRTWSRRLASDLTGCGRTGGQGLDPDVAIAPGGRGWVSQGFLSSSQAAVEHDAVREYVSSVRAPHEVSGAVDVDHQTPLQRGFLLPTSANTVYLETERVDYAGTYLPGWPVNSVTVRRSADGGHTWSQVGSVTGLMPGHAMLAGGLRRAGRLLVALAYDVNLATAAPALVASRGASASGALIAYRSDDGGTTWLRGGTVGTQSECCLGDFAAAADGTLYAAWPQTTTSGASIFLARSRDAGRSWTALVAARSSGSIPQAAVAVDRAGDVGLFWYSSRDNPRSPAELTPRLAVSRDHGQSWSRSIALAGPFDPATITTVNDGGPLGPYQDVEALPGGFGVAFTVGGSDVRAGGTSDVDYAEVSIEK